MTFEAPVPRLSHEYIRHLRNSPRLNEKTLSNWMSGRLVESYSGLHAVLESLSLKEYEDFFSKTVPFIQRLIAQFPLEFPVDKPLRALPQGVIGSVDLTQRQVAVLLACSLFNLYEASSDVNFHHISSSRKPSQVAKLNCILHYFRRLRIKEDCGDNLDRIITIHRTHIDDAKCDTERPLCAVRVEREGTIEDSEDALQIDFANEFIGGGVFRFGCVQEEIRFMLSPECLVSRLICERMNDFEAIVIIGSERYSQCSGYAASFRWDDNFNDDTPLDSRGRLACTIIGIDALIFSHQSFGTQFQTDTIEREILKASAGFSVRTDILQHEYSSGIATGNWGGDPQLKMLIQWLAASCVGRPLIYYTFGNKNLEGFERIVELAHQKMVSVSDLHVFLRRVKGDAFRNFWEYLENK